MARKRKPADPSDASAANVQTPEIVDEELRRRLLVVLQQRSRTEVARLTGTSLANVSRYASGTRMPTAFSVALVRNLGVNSAWWLTGKGAPFLADVADSAAGLSDDLLEIVQALNAVGQMRIGALAGKHHTRTLRELHDAMRRYEELRARLNRHSAPILRAMLEDLHRALDERKLDLARELCQAAEKLAGFCDDDALALDLALLHGKLAIAEVSMPEALEQSRKAVVLALRRGRPLEPKELEAVVEAVAAQRVLGRFSELRRMTDAAMSLATDEARASLAGRWLTIITADMQVLTGELQQGLQAITGVRGLLTGLPRVQADAMMARALWLSGAVDTEGAIRFGGDSLEKAALIVGLACLGEARDDVEKALDYMNRQGQKTGTFINVYAELLLRILRGERKGVAEAIREMAGAKPSVLIEKEYNALIAAQLSRLAGYDKDAARYFRQSCRDIASIPDDTPMTVIWRARHMRNMLALGKPEEQAEARRFFQDYVGRGYLCFSDLAK